ncbi:MAG TPA: MFS transporter [Solirubrobacterales bacterium]|nr:MFS transporter [Solirubrobacterales bacterium]
MRRSRLIDPLRRPQFRRLATSYAVNEMGDWMGIVALSVLVYDRTGSAMATAALFLGTRFLPALIAPVLVVRVEQPPPRFALPVVYCGEAAAFAALALLAGENFFLPGVIALAAIDGALALTGRSLTRAVVAALLEPAGELRSGNAVLNVAFTGGAALGPAIAGLVVAGFGVQTALLLDAVSFYAIAVILLTAGALPQAEPDPGQVRERVRAGIAYIRERPTLRRLLCAQGAAFVFFAAVIPIEVIYVKETLGAGDAGYGLMLASWGVGMVLGSLVFAAVRRASLPVLLFFSTIAVGIGYLGLAAAPALAAACAASVVGGAGNGVQWVSAISAVQELTTQGMQARVMSVLESIGAAMPGVGYLLGGLIASGASPRATFLVAGLGVLGIAFLAALVMGRKWPERREKARPGPLDAGAEIMVELIPVGERPPTCSSPSAPSDSEVVT